MDSIRPHKLVFLGTPRSPPADYHGQSIRPHIEQRLKNCLNSEASPNFGLQRSSETNFDRSSFAKECPKKRRQCAHRSSPFPPVINYGSNLHFYLVIRIHFLSSLSPPYQILAPAAADPEATHNGQTSAGQFDGQINSGLDRIHESEPGAVNAERARLKADAELLEFLRETAATERHSHYHNRCK